jgi:hypothetical protein
MGKIWLHRISAESDISYPLLEQGYLSIGFSDFVKDPAFVEEMIRSELTSKWEIFERANERIWGELRRGRYNLWRFLCEFELGDIVLVPTWGAFYLCQVVGPFELAGTVKMTGLTDGDGKALTSDGKLIYRGDKIVDLGFVRKIEKLTGELRREKYADPALIARMKMYQTNGDISDLRSSTEKILAAVKSGEKPDYYAPFAARLRKYMLDALRQALTPDGFESVVKWYLEKLGADFARIPAKNEAGKSDGADADVIATFETLKVVIYVQAKQHTGQTDDWAVTQIARYTEQKQEYIDTEYTYLSWVISTCDRFSEAAVKRAQSHQVRLINGRQFAGMLLDAGLNSIDKNFA